MKKLFSKSLRLRLTALVLLAVVLPTLVVMLLVSFYVTQFLQQNAQKELALRASELASTVSNWDEMTILTLRNLALQPDIVSMEAAQQKPVLTKAANVYTHMYLLSTTNLDGINVARNDDQEPKDYHDRPWFQGAAAGNIVTRQTLVSRTTNEPGVCFSTPIRNERDQINGVFVGCTDLTVLAEQVGAVRVGETGFAYLVDEVGQVLAHPNPAFSAELKDLSNYPPVQKVASGQSGPLSFVDQDGVQWLSHHIPLENGWGIVVQQTEREVLAQVQTFWQLAIGAILVVVLAIGILTWLVTGRVVRPITDLTVAATALSGGHLAQTITIENEDEVGTLAKAFNTMAEQLRKMIGGLEQRVAARTQRLETIANLGEQLSAILNFDQLLAELVEQVKDQFDYYHAHVYILAPERQALVMTAGAGEAGTQMKAEGHAIPLNALTSLVARAARSGEIVWVDNVREAEDWLPNPLLPDTYSEMAVPIVLEGQVVGVLDVQEDEVAGLDEGDANLLRSLANQVAVAIRNARLFEEVETALAQAHAAQEQYLEQAWDITKIGRQRGQFLYARPTAAPVDESKQQTLAAARQQALKQGHPAVIELNGDQVRTKSLVAPISLRDHTIGTLQLHASPDQASDWTDDDLAVIEAVVDQLAHTAENLRLFDQSLSRAGREQTIREITEKMRTANNLEELIKVTAEGLGRKLSAGHAVIELGLEPEAGQSGNGR